MLAIPAEPRSDAGICAVKDVLDPYVVCTALLFHNTCDADMNCVPVTVKVNAGSPSVALEGEIEPIVGTGLGGTLIVNLSAADVPPPGAGF